MKVLDSIGLAKLWAAIKAYVDGKVGDGAEITIVSVNDNLIVRTVATNTNTPTEP